MKILVTTPGGMIGAKVLRELLAPDFSVRVIVRDPERLPAKITQQVEVVRGSIGDASALGRALEGVEALFWCVPAESLQVANLERHYETFACAAWQAVRLAETPRVVTISAGGKGLARHAGPISGLHAMEEILNESGAAIRHLRCGFFMENLLLQARSILKLGLISYPMPRHIPLPMTAMADVAGVALRWLARTDWDGIEAVPVHGPEDLSFSQAAADVERALERPVHYQEASDTEYISGQLSAGTSVEYARGRLGMFAELALGIARAEPRTADSTTRTTLGAWAQRELVPHLEWLALRPETATAPLTPPSPPAYPHRNPGDNGREYIRPLRP